MLIPPDCTDKAYFNSRPCERGDVSFSWVYARSTAISIHAPARGATLSIRRIILWPNRFQFTPLREGRHDRIQ